MFSLFIVPSSIRRQVFGLLALHKSINQSLFALHNDILLLTGEILQFSKVEAFIITNTLQSRYTKIEFSRSSSLQSNALDDGPGYL